MNFRSNVMILYALRVWQPSFFLNKLLAMSSAYTRRQMSPVTVNGVLGVNVSYTRGRLRSLEALNFMGGGGIFELREFFLLIFPLQEYFFGMHGLFLGYSLCTIFSLNFPCTSPIKFLKVSPKDVC